MLKKIATAIKKADNVASTDAITGTIYLFFFFSHESSERQTFGFPSTLESIDRQQHKTDLK